MTTETTAFDYASLGDASGPVSAVADRVKARLKRIGEFVTEASSDVAFAKRILKGRYAEWLKIELGWDEVTATKFAAISDEHFSDIPAEKIPAVVGDLVSGGLVVARAAVKATLFDMGEES